MMGKGKLKRILFGLTTVSLFLTFTISCIPDSLPVEGLPKVQPQIVVSTTIIPDASILVLLTKSFGALDADTDSDIETLLGQISVIDAVVTIEGPSETYTLQPLDIGFYGGIQIPFVAGEIYTLKVVSPTMGMVYATTTVQQQVVFDQVQAQLYFNGFDDTLAQIDYVMKDPPGDNYYMMTVQEVEQEDVTQNVINPNAYTRLMTDEEFRNATFMETFRVFPREYDPGDTIAVSLSNISAEYYDFMQKRIDNRFGLVEFLGEPVNYPSNVVGGKGFFNLYVPDVRFFELY